MIKKLLQKLLTALAKAYLAKYKPKIVAVTGNAGKTSTKEAIATVLRLEKKIRMSGGNLNNELGVPLTILGDYAGEYYEKGGSIIFWLKVLSKSSFNLLRFNLNYPEILVLEYGADRPGDIAKLVENFKPDVAVVTAIGEIPVHVEYFSDSDELSDEKAKLVDSLESTNFAVLNADDWRVLEMKEKTEAQVKTFGFGNDADVKISDFDLKTGVKGEPIGVVFKLHTDQSAISPTLNPRLSAREFSSGNMTDLLEIKFNGSLGKSQSWAAGAAAAVGLIFGLNLDKISDALAEYQGSAGRLRILKGIKNSWIIDDTYNASPASTHLALETLKSLPKFHLETPFPSGIPRGRKVAVLGDMLELGKYTVQAHQEAGNFAGTFVDLLITVGPRAKFIAEAAGNQMLSENPASSLSADRHSEKGRAGGGASILSFDTSLEATPKIRDLIQEGDLVLVKGSQGMRMEKIVEEIMADPPVGGGKKRELLVRQSKKWLKK